MLRPFTQLRTNVKGAASLDLAPCTCIVGDNLKGKTSILDTIRLAVTGKHPVGANPRDLVELLPAGAEQLYAELRGPDGAFLWSMDAPGGRGRRSKGVNCLGAFEEWDDAQRAAVLVLDHGSTSAGFGPERMRRAIMTRYGTLQEVTPPRGLNEAQQKLWDQALSETSAVSSPADQLVAMHKWFKSTSKQAGDVAKSKEKTAGALQPSTEDVGGVDVEAQLRAQLKRARAYAEAVADRPPLADIVRELEDVTAEVTRLEQVDLLGKRSELEELTTRRSELTKALTRGKALAMLLERADDSVCPCCASTGVDVSVIRDELSGRIDERERESMELDNAISRLTQELRDTPLVQANNRKNKLEELRDSEPPTYRGPSIEMLESQLTKIQVARDAKQRVRQLTDDVQRLLDKQATAKLLEQQVSQLLIDYLQQVREQAESEVNEFMPSDFRASLKITDTVCQWRMYGVDQRTHKAGAYSGSEGGCLAIARAQAWGRSTPFKLALQDDYDLGVYDAKNLREVFGKFKQSVEAGLLTQAVLAWNRPHEVPDDWHIIHLGA